MEKTFVRKGLKKTGWGPEQILFTIFVNIIVKNNSRLCKDDLTRKFEPLNLLFRRFLFFSICFDKSKASHFIAFIH